MSFSLMAVAVGLPIMLAARVVMGKERFEEWLIEDELLYYTDFESIGEVDSVVKRAGYDLVDFLGSNKSHYGDKKYEYLLWEERDNKIVAVLSKSDDKDKIQKYVNDIERIRGRKTFFEQNERTQQESNHTQSIPTVYSDVESLIDVLKSFSIQLDFIDTKKIVCSYHGYEMYFLRESKEEPFNVKIVGDNLNKIEIYGIFKRLDEEYFTKIQENTYVMVKEKILNNNIEIEEEEVLEDNSIVLTISV